MFNYAIGCREAELSLSSCKIVRNSWFRSIVTARKRSCGKVMFFTPVGLFIGGGGGAILPRTIPPGTIAPRTIPLFPEPQNAFLFKELVLVPLRLFGYLFKAFPCNVTHVGTYCWNPDHPAWLDHTESMSVVVWIITSGSAILHNAYSSIFDLFQLGIVQDLPFSVLRVRTTCRQFEWKKNGLRWRTSHFLVCTNKVFGGCIS